MEIRSEAKQTKTQTGTVFIRKQIDTVAVAVIIYFENYTYYNPLLLLPKYRHSKVIYI